MRVRESSLIEKNTFSSRVKLLREPWCETGRSAGGAIIRIPASLIREIAEPLYIVVLPLFSFLQMDNNRICAVHGSPFNDMPRLRVLSLRSNRMTAVSENAFKRLRSNIAVLDIDGNLKYRFKLTLDHLKLILIDQFYPAYFCSILEK